MPLVSVYIPTYNREETITNTIESVKSQTFQDWELIIVDDGSTDDTRKTVLEATKGFDQPVRYVYHENRGLFYSRNVGANHATGKYVAPLDSDDVWEPHHLSDCLEVLKEDESIDWVYGALRRVDSKTGEIVLRHSFYNDATPKPFLKLEHRELGRSKVFTDPELIKCAIKHGLASSQQCSLIKRSVLTQLPFSGRYRICEDQQYPIRAIAHGVKLAYLDDVHLSYMIHDENISNVNSSLGTAKKQDIKKQILVQEELIEVLSELHLDSILDESSLQVLNNRLANEYFWRLGYGIHLRHGQYAGAMKSFRRGMRLRPFYLPYWKSYCATVIKRMLRK